MIRYENSAELICYIEIRSTNKSGSQYACQWHRTLTKLRSSKGDYWNEQRFSSIAPLFKMGISLIGKNLLPEKFLMVWKIRRPKGYYWNEQRFSSLECVQFSLHTSGMCNGSFANACCNNSKIMLLSPSIKNIFYNFLLSFVSKQNCFDLTNDIYASSPKSAVYKLMIKFASFNSTHFYFTNWQIDVPHLSRTKVQSIRKCIKSFDC